MFQLIDDWLELIGDTLIYPKLVIVALLQDHLTYKKGNVWRERSAERKWAYPEKDMARHAHIKSVAL